METDLVERQPRWRDRKRYWWLLGLAVPTLPFQAGALVALTGVRALWWWGPFFALVIVPLVDLSVREDRANPPEAVMRQLELDRYYRWCTYLYLPLQYAALLWACAQWAGGALSAVDSTGLALTTAIVSAIAVNTAHELGHKREALERRLSRIALAQPCYGHFYVEHNHGHHVRVATPQDPASSRMGESFWRFLPRTVLGSVVSAWQLEAKRLARRGRPVFSVRNDVLTSWLLSVILLAALSASFGPGVLPWLLLQAAGGICLLESVNYLEHYGLLRAKRPDGRYDRVAPGDSWNSNRITSNLFLYQLQRHSDHHANPLRRYQTLRHVDASPQLPAGYASMVVLAWIPVLWRHVMDRRLLAHYGGDVTRANLHPPARARLIQRYGTPSPSTATTAYATRSGVRSESAAGSSR